MTCDTNKATHSKGGEIRDTKTLHLLRHIVSLQVFVDVSCFLQRGSTLSNTDVWLCCSFIVKLTTCRATNSLVPYLANQPISTPHFFNPQQMFLLRDKLITSHIATAINGKTCNETMLRDKLEVFVSHISSP